MVHDAHDTVANLGFRDFLGRPAPSPGYEIPTEINETDSFFSNGRVGGVWIISLACLPAWPCHTRRSV